LAKKKGQKLFGDSATKTTSESIEMNEVRERVIATCKKLQSQIRGVGRPLSVQMEESFRNICKVPLDGSLTKYPELQAEVDAQKILEKRVNEKLKAELARLMKENNLTEEDLKDEYA
jgi:hypothetical protein